MKSLETLEQSRAKYKNGYYGSQLDVGLVFQDAVTKLLYSHGIVVVGYASRQWQLQYGENMLGAEIKRDGNFRRTGNLYIETAEKSHPDLPHYVPSGIDREDNSWLFIIGDEQTLYIFSIKYLRKMRDRWKEVQKPTSIGRLMPIADAEKWNIRKLESP